MHVHANPILWEVRVFSSDIGPDGSTGYDRREAHKEIAVLLVRRLADDNECFASLLMGEWSPQIMRAVRKKAKEHGFSVIRYERHGGKESMSTE
jgi:hypothetical protein